MTQLRLLALPIALSLSATLLGACSDDGQGSETSDSDAGTDSVGESESDTTAGTTTTDTTTTDTTDTTSADTTDTGPDACDPEDNAYVAFSLGGVDEGQALDWSLECALMDFGPGDGESGYLITLDNCVDQGPNPQVPPALVELFVDASPDALGQLWLPDVVQLRWVQVPPFYAGRWFTLRDQGGQTLLLAGIDGPSQLPDAPNFDYDPVTVDFVDRGCETFDADACATGQRWGLTLGWDDVQTTILDKNAGYVGQLVSYQGVVDTALNYTDIVCDDFPSAAIRALLVLIPEG